MNWQKRIDLDTFHDAWLTWDTFFREKINPSITFDVFYQLSLKAKYKTITINQYIATNPENGGIHRLKAQTAELAYVDSPRGDDDIKSVYYHMTTKECISPIVLIKIKDKSNNIRLIKLDGVHRVVAANLINSKIKIAIINATSPFKVE